MGVKDIHRGTSLESWLEEEGILAEATVYAIKSVIAWQLGEEMKKKKINKKRMTEMMQVSHAQLNHVLDPQSKNTHLETLQSAAKSCNPSTTKRQMPNSRAASPKTLKFLLKKQ